MKRYQEFQEMSLSWSNIEPEWVCLDWRTTRLSTFANVNSLLLSKMSPLSSWSMKMWTFENNYFLGEHLHVYRVGLITFISNSKSIFLTQITIAHHLTWCVYIFPGFLSSRNTWDINDDMDLDMTSRFFSIFPLPFGVLPRSTHLIQCCKHRRLDCESRSSQGACSKESE